MQIGNGTKDAADDKDQIIKRQALEIAALAARLTEQDDAVREEVQRRTVELINENEQLREQQRELSRLLGTAIKSTRVLCRNEGERLKFLMAMEVVDEDWYRREYPDVAENYPKGPLHHYCRFGMFEGRKPNGSM